MYVCVDDGGWVDGWVDRWMGECLLSDEVREKISKTECSFIFHLPFSLSYSVYQLIPILTKKEKLSGFRSL